jgi:hypothetical protein
MTLPSYLFAPYFHSNFLLQLDKLRADFSAKDNLSNFAKLVAIKSENSFLKVIKYRIQMTLWPD